MGRRSTPIHLLTAERRGSQAIVRYRGKRITLGPWNVQADCPSEAAERKLAALKATWRVSPRAGLAADDDPLLLDLWCRWVASPQAPCDRSSEATWCRRLMFGTSAEPGPYLEMRASEFTAGELQRFQDHLCQLRNDRGELRFSRWSVLRFVSLARRCMEWGVVAGLVDDSQANSLKLVQPPKRGQVKEPVPRGAVSWEHVELVTSTMESEARLLLLCLWWTGARPGELCGLQSEQIQRHGLVTSRKKVSVDLGELGLWATVLTEHKTASRGKERILFFGPEAQKLLSAVIDRPGLLFRKPNGKPYHHHQLARYSKLACDRKGIPRWTPYQISHAFLSRVAAEFSREMPGLGLIAAKAARGHSVAALTEGYAGSDIITAARVAQRCG